MYQIETAKNNMAGDILVLLDYCYHQDPIDRYQTVREEQFSFLFLSRLRSENTREAYLKIKLIVEYYTKGLNEAKVGAFKKAEAYFEQGKLYRKGLEETQELLVDALTLPNIAYLKYQKEWYALAMADLYKAIKINDQLIDAGYYFLHSHKIQQVHNLIRVHVKMEEWTKVKDLNLKLLAHLIKDREPDWDVGNWNPALLDQVPDTLLESMIFQVTNEMINCIILTTNLEKKNLEKEFKIAFKDLPLYEELDFPFLPSQGIGHFLYLMKLYFRRNHKLFIVSVVDFLSIAPHSCNIWKYVLVDCLQKIAQKNGTKQELKQVDRMVQDYVANSLKINPETLQTLLAS